MRFTLALLAAATAVMAQGPISQISDGQIQNPTTPIVVYSTQSPAPYPAGNSSSIAAVGTGYTSAVPTGPYSNSTASAGSSSAAASPTSSTPAATSSTAAESTGGAVALQAGGFGLAAAIAALIIA